MVGLDTAEAVWSAMPPKTHGWSILPIVGRRDRPEQLTGEAIETKEPRKGRKRKAWTEKQALDALFEIASRNQDSTGGLIVFFDEMGKLLEGSARDGSDVYFFQQLADMASRSNGRLIVVGILHQAFEEYSYRLSREMRDEWSKIQGRFIDLPVSTGGDEQIDLLGRAIYSGRGAVEPGLLSETVATLTNRTGSIDLPQLLEACWPLHPVVACLLGPISRRRFGRIREASSDFLTLASRTVFRISCDKLKMASYTPPLSFGSISASTWNLPSWHRLTGIGGPWRSMPLNGAKV